jgi:enoyl-CoA hydratase/3-hydroxyacyl-CoA dehydrogenase
MKLVEITKSKYTGNDTLQTTIELCKSCKKEPLIVQKDVWYFLAGRARFGWSAEANLTYLRQEADFREIDAVAKYKLGLPMGEFELMDFTGAVDIRTRSLASTEEILKRFPEFEPWPPFLAVFRQLTKELWQPMTEKGLIGIKSGKGFYLYPEGKYVKPEIPKELADKVKPIQLLAPAINVAAGCVSGGIGSIDDINKSFRLAYGWPKGILEFIEEYGASSIISVLKMKREKAPGWLKEFYQPDPLLTRWNS